MRAYIIAALLITVIFGSIAGYLYRQFSVLAATDFTPPPVAVNVDMATRATWNRHLEAVGTIKALRGVELSTEESGEVTAIEVSSGGPVAAGDLLLTLNDKVEQASRERQIAQ